MSAITKDHCATERTRALPGHDWHVHIPKQRPHGEWQFIGEFKHKDAARDFLTTGWHIPRRFTDLFITKGMEATK